MFKLIKLKFWTVLLGFLALFFAGNTALAADLTTINVTPESANLGVITNHAISFRTSANGAINQGGMIWIRYPHGFNLSQVTLGTDLGGNLGNASLIRNIDTVVIMVGANSNIGNSTLVSFQLNGVVNPSLSGNYAVTVESQNNLGQNIDGPNTSSTFNIGQILDHFSVVPSTASTTVGSDIALTITAQDANNSTITSYNGTPAPSGLVTSPDGTVPYYGPITFINGMANVTVRGYSAQSGQSVTIADSGRTGNSGVINLAFGPLDIININPNTNQTVTAGQTLQFTATSTDSYGNLRSGDIFTWTNTTNSGLFNTTTTGSYSIRASSANIDSTIVNVTVVHAEEIDHLSISPTDIHLSNADQTQVYLVEARDQFANSWNVTNQIVFSTTDPKGLFKGNIYSAGQVGSWIIKATLGDKNISTSVTIDNPGAPAKLEFTNSVNQIDLNTICDFNAKVSDIDSNQISGANIVWSVVEGSDHAVIDSNGRFIANKVGTYQVKIQSGNISTTLTVKVVDPNANKITVEQLNSTDSISSKNTGGVTSTPSSASSNQSPDSVSQNTDQTVVVTDDSQGKIKATEITTEGAGNVSQKQSKNRMMYVTILVGLAILALAYWGYNIWFKLVEQKVKPENKEVKSEKNVPKPEIKSDKPNTITKEIPQIKDTDDKTRW